MAITMVMTIIIAAYLVFKGCIFFVTHVPYFIGISHVVAQAVMAPAIPPKQADDKAHDHEKEKHFNDKKGHKKSCRSK
jgi:hypothetical protein